MKLELKHLAPYLPYGLKFMLTKDQTEDFSSADFYEDGKFDNGCIWTLSGYADEKLNIPAGDGELEGFIYSNDHVYACFDYGISPILRPINDLATPLYLDQLTSLMPYGRQVIVDLCKVNAYSLNVSRLDIYDFQKLFEWHFDVFGLIPAGLAIDINTINQE